MKDKLRVREQTRTSSPTLHNESTELTISPPKPMQGITAAESMRTAEWTDEKHSMYLKSIEASFVNQLYDSKQMQRQRQSLPSLARKGTSSDPPTTSGQFKVLRGGCWQKINFERENHQRKSRMKECQDLTANRWIQHYRSSSRQRSVAVPSFEDSVTCRVQGQWKGISSDSGHLHFCESHMCHQDMLSRDTEVSDQNFVDEEVEGEKQNNRNNMKRQKSLMIDAKGNDQIVPINKSSTIGDVTKNLVSAA